MVQHHVHRYLRLDQLLVQISPASGFIAHSRLSRNIRQQQQQQSRVYAGSTGEKEVIISRGVQQHDASLSFHLQHNQMNFTRTYRNHSICNENTDESVRNADEHPRMSMQMYQCCINVSTWWKDVGGANSFMRFFLAHSAL